MTFFTSDAGISRELARYRAARIADLHYLLDCTISARARVLEGRQQIRFRLRKALDRPALVLDWRPELDVADAMRTVRSIRVNGRRNPRCEFREGHLHVPARALTPGVNCIELEWCAPIRESASALTRYRDGADGAVYVYSLFVPADASTVFPCFDQPDVKGRFSLALTVPSSWHALANAPLVTSERVRGGRKLVFAATEPISTYAFAFAAGPFVALGRPDDPTLVWIRRSQRSRAQRHLTEILRLNAVAVRYCTRYFGHPFPFRKYDLALIPQFPYRGMEHAGATFLNEDAVLLPQPHGLAARFQRAQLIFHETAHQWMGDLVTMRWFDDLWIKEGFANFVAFKLAERAISQSYARIAFHELKLGAYETDATPGATALHHPVADLTQAKSAYNTIVYAKAPAVLRMLEHALGARTFRSAMRALVTAHAYRALDWRELIAALEHASGRSLERWAKMWLLRPGAPSLRGPYAGMLAHEYALPQPDRTGVAQAVRSLGRTRDALRRHQLWEYLWAALGACMLDPKRFIALAIAHAHAEVSELTVARLSARLRIALDRLLDLEERERLGPEMEKLALGAFRSSKAPDLRLAWMRAAIALSRTAAAQAKLRTLPAGHQSRLALPDRIAIAAALVATGRDPMRMAAKRITPNLGSRERGLAVHCLQAAVPHADRKRALFDRWLEDPALPEDWIDAALPYLNHPAHAELTVSLLARALDALPVLVRTRKIFFVNRWLAHFIAGQCSADAIAVVRRFLRRTQIAPALRLKVLEASHALERDVAVFEHWHA